MSEGRSAADSVLTKYKDIGWVLAATVALAYCCGWMSRWMLGSQYGSFLVQQPKESCIAAGGVFLLFCLPVVLALSLNFSDVKSERVVSLILVLLASLVVALFVGLMIPTGWIQTTYSLWDMVCFCVAPALMIALYRFFFGYRLKLEYNFRHFTGVFLFVYMLVQLNLFSVHVMMFLPESLGGFPHRLVKVHRSDPDEILEGSLVGNDANAVVLAIQEPDDPSKRPPTTLQVELIPWSQVKSIKTQ